jgi:hypothetical protein
VSGIELVEEHEVFYGQPQLTSSDPVRICLAGVVAFIATCITFTVLGGADQSGALIPAYWAAFGGLWWALS